MSASTRRGWWKLPTRFLPCAILMPVLPPTELSTWDSSVVGIWMKGTPRSRIEAGKAGQVAHHAAAEGQQGRRPLRTRIEDGGQQRFQPREALAALARRHAIEM